VTTRERRHPRLCIYFAPQLFVFVPASTQHTSPGDAHVPLLHHEVSALQPGVSVHAQHVGRQSSGALHALPAAPLFHGNVAEAPTQSTLPLLALAIDPISVTAIGAPVHDWTAG